LNLAAPSSHKKKAFRYLAIGHVNAVFAAVPTSPEAGSPGVNIDQMA
jgi:hypothetical protein